MHVEGLRLCRENLVDSDEPLRHSLAHGAVDGFVLHVVEEQLGALVRHRVRVLDVAQHLWVGMRATDADQIARRGHSLREGWHRLVRRPLGVVQPRAEYALQILPARRLAAGVPHAVPAIEDVVCAAHKRGMRRRGGRRKESRAHARAEAHLARAGRLIGR